MLLNSPDKIETLATKHMEFLSPCNGNIMDYCSSNRTHAIVISEKARVHHHQEVLDVGYEVGPWPIILNSERVADFVEFIQTLPVIFKQVLENYFTDGSAAFSTYFNEPAMVHKLLVAAQIDIDELVVRYDLVFSDGILKLIEANSGSNLGGFEVDWQHLKTLAAVKTLPLMEKRLLSYRPVVKTMVNALAKFMPKLNKENKTGNILFRTDQLPTEVSAVLSHFIQGHYEAAEHYQGGQIFLCSDISRFEFKTSNEVYFQGQSMDAVVLLDGDMPVFYYNKLISAYMSKQIVFPDSPVHQLFGNKIVMALVHEEKAKELLSNEQNQWVEKHVPWTVKTDKTVVNWESNSYRLSDLLSQKKDRFVLKKAVSFQGTDVHIGLFTSPQKWETLLTQLLGDPGWIVQEFCPSDVIYVSDLNSLPTHYIPVWGAFGFGNYFGGSFARALSIDAGSGVVNMATGAIKLAALEDQTKDQPDCSFNTIRGSTHQVDKIELPAEYLHNNQSHSTRFKDLVLHLQSDKVMKNYHIHAYREDFPPFMQGYDYTVSAWPFIISSQQVSQFEDFIKPLAKLFYRAIDLYFGSDSEKFSNYLNEPPVVLDLLRQTDIDSRDVIARHDVLFSKNEFKLVEVNVGSSIGGWEVDWLSSAFDRALKLSSHTASWNLKQRNATKNTFAAICGTIARTKPGATGNVLAFSPQGFFNNMACFRESNCELYQQVSPFKQGSLFFFHDFEQLDFGAAGEVKFEGKVMDAVLLSIPDDVDVPPSIMMRLVSSYLSRNIVLPDNPVHEILGNKIMMGLMHEPALQQKLDAQSLVFINRYIPWTAKVNQTEVFWQGQMCNFETLLKDNKDQFVLKKNRSMQGSDVFIGRFMDNETWQSSIRLVQNDNDWLVQAYHEPDSVIASSDKSELGIYKPVWGIFDLNNSYGGAFVRATTITNGDGIINSVRGALEFAVREECSSKKMKITL